MPSIRICHKAGFPKRLRNMRLAIGAASVHTEPHLDTLAVAGCRRSAEGGEAHATLEGHPLLASGWCSQVGCP